MRRSNARSAGTIDADIELPLIASMLMQSLSSVGYAAAAVLADLIDNSIAAHAHIRVSNSGTPHVAVIDDGQGMEEATLVSAMRFRSTDPRGKRHGVDLGRFGLGLKTASLSQCRRLTVATINAGELLTARWDLAECDRRATWWLERPDLADLPAAILNRHGRGTAVIWQHVDRLEAAGGDRAILEAADYLCLAFHHFLVGEIAGSFSILLNEHASRHRSIPCANPYGESDRPRR